MAHVCLHQNEYPLFSATGSPLGFRSKEATARLLAGDHVRPIFGRKGRLKAIVLPKKDGSHPIKNSPELGPKFSYRRRLKNHHSVWELKKLGKGDEMRPMFVRVLADCLTTSASDSNKM